MTEVRSVPRCSGRHWLHGADRAWPETNCYLDLWIELLPALGRDPLPLLGVAAAMDWEVDHFTFLKPHASDIFAMTGVTLHELALWDDVADHIVGQVATGAIPLLEVDAFFLPDTLADAYRHKHTKTTIAIAAIDPGRRSLEYFHNAGRFDLEGEDYDGVLGRQTDRASLFPFAELARIAVDPLSPSQTQELSRNGLSRFARSRAPGNPVARFAAALPALMDRTGSDPARVNAFCFNTTRQLGAAFGLFADHLKWLGENDAAAILLADKAKSLQFRIARAARRKRPDPSVPVALAELAALWTECMAPLGLHTPDRPAPARITVDHVRGHIAEIERSRAEVGFRALNAESVGK